MNEMGGKTEWRKRDGSEATEKFTHRNGGILSVILTKERALTMRLDGKDNWKNCQKSFALYNLKKMPKAA